MCQRAHVSGATDHHLSARREQAKQTFGNQSARCWCMLAAKDRHGTIQGAVGAVGRSAVLSRGENIYKHDPERRFERLLLGSA